MMHLLRKISSSCPLILQTYCTQNSQNSVMSAIGLSAKKETTNFTSANFHKMFHPSYIILRIQRVDDCVDPDEAAHVEVKSAVFVTGA